MNQNGLQGVKIAVVGAGVVGASVTYRLAQADADVTIFERNDIGSGTSGMSFAWLNGFNKSPQHYYELNRESIQDHLTLQDEVGGDWLRIGGLLQWANTTDPVAVDRLREKVEQLRGWGAQIDELTPQSVMDELEPQLRIDPDKVETVYRVASEGWLNGAEMVRPVIAAAVDRYGARVVRAAVHEISPQSGGGFALKLSSGDSNSFDIVVNAAGPDSARVAALAGVELPVERVVGMIIETTESPAVLSHVVRCPEAILRPAREGTGKYLLHPPTIDQHASEDTTPPLESPFVVGALEQACEVVPRLAAARAEQLRIGVRPIPADGYPIAGFDPDTDGFYSVVTHSGITLAARLGILVAEDIATGNCPALELYRPTRFAQAPA